MKIKCRGYEGELTYLDVTGHFRNAKREPVNVYRIWISPDKNTTIELSNVKDCEIEVARKPNTIEDAPEKVTINVDGKELKKAIEGYLYRE